MPVVLLFGCSPYEYQLDDTMTLVGENVPVESSPHSRYPISLTKGLTMGVPLFVAPGYSCLLLSDDELISFDWESYPDDSLSNSCRNAVYKRFFLSREDNITIRLDIGNSEYRTRKPSSQVTYRELSVDVYVVNKHSCVSMLNFLPYNSKENLLYADYSLVTASITATPAVRLHSCNYAVDVMEFLIDNHLG